MAGRNGTGVAAAAGYPQFSGSLISPVFGQSLISRFYCSTVFGEIMSTEYYGEIGRCGDSVTFWEEPNVSIQTYVKDGQLKHNTFETKPIVLSIDQSLAYSFKLDRIDEQQMCNSQEWMKQVLYATSRNMANAIDDQILNNLYLEADKSNRGANAGVCTGCVNLGEVGAPLVIDTTNILDFLANLRTVFDEACVPMENRWIVVPPKFMNLFDRSELRNAQFSGLDRSTLLNGYTESMASGFRIYVSNHIKPTVDPATNDMVWNLVAGWKGAAVFASQIEHTRRIDADKDNFDIYYQGLMVWGSGVVRSDGLAHIYAKLA